MKRILVTGAAGFIGRNLLMALRRLEDVEILTQDIDDPPEDLTTKTLAADLIFHLAGVNRPDDDSEFAVVNLGLTETITTILRKNKHNASIVITSSAQAERDNAYGRSKKAAEDHLIEFSKECGNKIAIYRLPGVFGKWSRPNYNTVVATFCHNVARDLPIAVSNPDHVLTLVYIDEVVRCFLRHVDAGNEFSTNASVEETHDISLGDLAERIRSFKNMRQSLLMPDVSDRMTKCLYTTYLSFLPEDDFSYPVNLRTDDRGWLFELAKSKSFGQIFVSTTKPGITRGNHFHDTKVEKFCLIQGNGLIRFRDIDSTEIIEYPVSDAGIRIVDIPPGYTHSIENTGDREMVVLFWANEVFDPQNPDTYWTDVLS